MAHHNNPQDEPNLEGMSADEREQYGRAIADFEAASKRNEQFWMDYIDLAVALADRGSHDEAIGLYDMMIQLDPDEETLYRARGGSYEAKAEYEQAIVDYGEAIRIDPDYRDAIMDLADAQSKHNPVNGDQVEEDARSQFELPAPPYIPRDQQPVFQELQRRFGSDLGSVTIDQIIKSFDSLDDSDEDYKHLVYLRAFLECLKGWWETNDEWDFGQAFLWAVHMTSAMLPGK